MSKDTSARLEPTPLLLEDELELEELTNIKGIKGLDHKIAKKNISYFAFHYLGIKPQRFQHMIFREVERGNKRLCVGSSRQIGKSLAYQIVALWAAFYDKFPTGSASHNKNTKVLIVSKSDEQAKKFMNDIRNLIYAGDARIHTLTGGTSEKFFSRRIDEKKENTKTSITFLPRGGSVVGPVIKCFPPTGAIRGETGNVVIIDEAAFVDDEVYNEDVKKTVTRTDGLILLSSTPKGQSGFFYQIMDPFNKFKIHEYKRFCFPWQVCEDERQIEMVKKDKDFAEKTGNMRSFRQEYEVSFEADNQSFFESGKIDDMVDDRISEVYEYKDNPAVLAIDYGMTTSRTVVTISTKEDEVKPYRLLYQREFPENFDESELMIESNEFSVPSLAKRFNIRAVVVDDCAQGYRTNKELENKGYYVMRFNFRSDQADRNRGYTGFRSLIHQGLVRAYNLEELEVQMKQIEIVSGKIHDSIRKPQGGRDDRVDSFMMSLYPWVLEELGEDGFSVAFSENSQRTIDTSDPRTDHELERFGFGRDVKTMTKTMEEEYKLWYG